MPLGHLPNEPLQSRGERSLMEIDPIGSIRTDSQGTLEEGDRLFVGAEGGRPLGCAA